MHVIMSARAGTYAGAFEGAVRDFLADQFAGHRYVFAMHDPETDTKEAGEGASVRMSMLMLSSRCDQKPGTASRQRRQPSANGVK